MQVKIFNKPMQLHLEMVQVIQVKVHMQLHLDLVQVIMVKVEIQGILLQLVI